MNGSIAQIVALTGYGNAFLSGQDVGTFFPKNSTCTFCDRVSFVMVEKTSPRKGKEAESKTANEWFSFLKSSAVRGIRLSRIPKNDPPVSDHMMAGFIGGGGTWAMEVLFPKNHSEYWIARWKVWNRNAPENRIWRVAYGRIASGVTPILKSADLTDVAIQLSKSLREIHVFSKKHKCDGFTKTFEAALDTLNSSGKNLHGYHKDLAPDGFLSTAATVILDASQSAWVFGGMGSWNDVWFDEDDQKEYERVSEQLFQTITEAIVAGTNSTYEGLHL